MRGLTSLASDLSALLTEAYIEEQNAAALMSEELRQCERHLHSTSSGDEGSEANDSSASKRGSRAPSFQLALKRAMTVNSRSEHGEVTHKVRAAPERPALSDPPLTLPWNPIYNQVSDITRRHVQSRLGRAFDEGARVMDTKLYAFEAVHNIVRGYTKFTAAIAKVTNTTGPQLTHSLSATLT